MSTENPQKRLKKTPATRSSSRLQNNQNTVQYDCPVESKTSAKHVDCEICILQYAYYLCFLAQPDETRDTSAKMDTYKQLCAGAQSRLAVVLCLHRKDVQFLDASRVLSSDEINSAQELWSAGNFMDLQDGAHLKNDTINAIMALLQVCIKPHNVMISGYFFLEAALKDIKSGRHNTMPSSARIWPSDGG